MDFLLYKLPKNHTFKPFLALFWSEWGRKIASVSVFKPTADFEQTTHSDQLYAVLSVWNGLVWSSQTVYIVQIIFQARILQSNGIMGVKWCNSYNGSFAGRYFCSSDRWQLSVAWRCVFESRFTKASYQWDSWDAEGGALRGHQAGMNFTVSLKSCLIE